MHDAYNSLGRCRSELAQVKFENPNRLTAPIRSDTKLQVIRTNNGTNDRSGFKTKDQGLCQPSREAHVEE